MIFYTQEDIYQLFLSMIRANASSVQWWLDNRARDLLNAEGNKAYDDIDSISRQDIEKYFSPSHMNNVQRMRDLHQITMPQEIMDILYETPSNELPLYLNAPANADVHNKFLTIVINWRLSIGK